MASRLHEVGQDLRVILYDVTSTYFRGRESEPVRFGYSRDHGKDGPQIAVGLVTTEDSLPLTHRVCPKTPRMRPPRSRFVAGRTIFADDRDDVRRRRFGQGALGTRKARLVLKERRFDYDVSARGRPRLRFGLNEEEVKKARMRDGPFVLGTNVLDLSAEEIVRAIRAIRMS